MTRFFATGMMLAGLVVLPAAAQTPSDPNRPADGTTTTRETDRDDNDWNLGWLGLLGLAGLIPRKTKVVHQDRLVDNRTGTPRT